MAWLPPAGLVDACSRHHPPGVSRTSGNPSVRAEHRLSAQKVPSWPLKDRPPSRRKRSEANLIPPAHSAILLAIALTPLAQFFLVETSFPHFTTILPRNGSAMVARLYPDASRPRLYVLRERGSGQGKEGRSGYSECISAHRIPPA